MRSYLFEHIVSFEETNALGNVYFSNFLKWQGVCRERFLKEHVPELISQFSGSLRIATLECSCSYYWELYPFDSITVEMFLDDRHGSPGATEPDVLRLCFKYWKTDKQQRLLAAEGEQKIAFLYSRSPNSWERGHLPAAVKEALIPFGLAAL